jgi:hypothetical protein
MLLLINVSGGSVGSATGASYFQVLPEKDFVFPVGAFFSPDKEMGTA